jgi:L-ribulose-5-phosphate 4-epimerase
MDSNDDVIDDGYIKFQLEMNAPKAIPKNLLQNLQHYRELLYNQGLIGMYDNGIGFGNISSRLHGNAFVISASATGGKSELSEVDFCIVEQCDIARNKVWACGQNPASSESMTHHVLYQLEDSIGGVIHVHSLALWRALCGKVPTTSANIAYGTPEMASEMQRLYCSSNLSSQKILAMAGHSEGIVTFGVDLAQAYGVLDAYVREWL